MDKVVTRYLKEHTERRLYESILGLVVFQWLNDLVINPGNKDEEPEKTTHRRGTRKSKTKDEKEVKK